MKKYAEKINPVDFIQTDKTILMNLYKQNKLFENNFQKLKSIGKGTYGEVWLAKKYKSDNKL